MTITAGICGPIAAASQSTVFVRVGNSGGTGYGFANIAFGSVSPGSVLGKVINELYSDNINRLTVRLVHGGTPLTKSLFRTIRVSNASGIVALQTSAASFTADSAGSSQWQWSGAAIFGESDLGASRVVGFFR